MNYVKIQRVFLGGSGRKMLIYEMFVCIIIMELYKGSGVKLKCAKNVMQMKIE